VSRAHFFDYMVGQCSKLERKSIEPMALQVEGGTIRGLQRFISDVMWDEEQMVWNYHQLVANERGDPNGVLMFDESGFVKKGQDSVGVARQLSLSRLNHWLPRGQPHPEVVQGTAEFHHQIGSCTQGLRIMDQRAHSNRKLRFQGFCRSIRLIERVFWSFYSTVRSDMQYWLAFSWPYNLLSDKVLRITVYSCANAPAGPGRTDPHLAPQGAGTKATAGASRHCSHR
jgi:hypothetical protein